MSDTTPAYNSVEPQCVAVKGNGDRCTNGTTYSPILCGTHKRVTDIELAPDTDDRDWFECPDCGWQPVTSSGTSDQPTCPVCGDAFPDPRTEWSDRNDAE